MLELMNMKSESLMGDVFYPGSQDFFNRAREVYVEVYGRDFLTAKDIWCFGQLRVYAFNETHAFSNSPLRNHISIDPLPTYLKLVEAAVKILEGDHAEDWQLLQKNLRGITFVKLDPGFQHVDNQVTSITLPGLPYISILSEKAFFHAPPLLIKNAENAVILAENIIHEATHQWVNLNLVDNELINESYSSKTSRKIAIPWRSKAFNPRDRRWPIDRCLHAAVVYLIVARFRKRAMQSVLSVSPYQSEDVRAAVGHGQFLADAVGTQLDYFTEAGRQFITSLKQSFKAMDV